MKPYRYLLYGLQFVLAAIIMLPLHEYIHCLDYWVHGAGDCTVTFFTVGSNGADAGRAYGISSWPHWLVYASSAVPMLLAGAMFVDEFARDQFKR